MIRYIYILFFFVPNKKKYEIEFICSRFFLSCCCLILYEDDIIFSLGEVGEFRLNRDNSAHTHTECSAWQLDVKIDKVVFERDRESERDQ